MKRSTLPLRTFRSLLGSVLGGLVLLSLGCGPDPNADLDPPADQPEERLPPSNWSVLQTSGAPTQLSVKANSNKSSGTSNDNTLVYRNSTATYSCTITATISDGGSQTCVPTKSSNETSNAKDYLYVKYADKSNSQNNSDGLLLTSIGVLVGGSGYGMDSFNMASELI